MGLREHLANLPRPLFAVVDGAQFPSLPGELATAGLVATSLYRSDGIERDTAVAAPRLVPLGDDATAERLLDLVGERPACVLWSCPEGEAVLYRHLRGLNKVLIPAEAAEAASLPAWEEAPLGAAPERAREPYELVLFRHADANVMAQTLPALDGAGFARLFGPATHLAYAPGPDYGGGTHLALRPDGLPRPPTGPLTIDAAAIERIGEARAHAARRRRGDYLRRTCRETAGASDAAVAEHVRVSEQTGADLGLVSEAAHCRWAFVMAKSNGRVLQEPRIADFIARGERSPDEQMALFMKGMIAQLKTGA